MSATSNPPTMRQRFLVITLSSEKGRDRTTRCGWTALACLERGECTSAKNHDPSDPILLSGSRLACRFQLLDPTRLLAHMLPLVGAARTSSLDLFPPE